uniref:Transmembrane protein n=1 Tax=Macrostomum lignano TaxID=282301 RepID=A0A1I8H4K1_9PLAT
MEVAAKIPEAIDAAIEGRNAESFQKRLGSWLILPGVMILYLSQFVLDCTAASELQTLTFNVTCPEQLTSHCSCSDRDCTAAISHLQPLYILFVVIAGILLIGVLIVFSTSCCCVTTVREEESDSRIDGEEIRPGPRESDSPINSRGIRACRSALLLSLLISLLHTVPLNALRAQYLHAFRKFIPLRGLIKLLLPPVCALLLAIFAFLFRVPFSFWGRCSDLRGFSTAGVVRDAIGNPGDNVLLSRPWRVLHFCLILLSIIDCLCALLALLLGI